LSPLALDFGSFFIDDMGLRWCAPGDVAPAAGEVAGAAGDVVRVAEGAGDMASKEKVQKQLRIIEFHNNMCSLMVCLVLRYLEVLCSNLRSPFLDFIIFFILFSFFRFF
jgi:hypothetical protein